jgi:hypothetical protein
MTFCEKPEAGKEPSKKTIMQFLFLFPELKPFSESKGEFSELIKRGHSMQCPCECGINNYSGIIQTAALADFPER